MKSGMFNRKSRSLLHHRCTSELFDLLIIGGGITGSSIFRDAALRGLKTVLVEAKDFSSGTSSRSSKLFHGGLRYIRSFDFHLTKEACRERNRALQLNPRLVKPIPFMIPVYKRNYQKCKFCALLHAYDFLSGYNNYKNHTFVSIKETLSLAPGLPAEGLAGSYVYYDALVNDLRYTLETIKDGVKNGGYAFNYMKVTSFIKSEGRICGVSCIDTVGNTHHRLYARSVVNASGSFTDTLRKLDDPNCTPLLRLSRATHLVFAKKHIPFHITLTFFSPIDGRVLFLISHDDCFLYGTTDTWFKGNPASPCPENDDVDYLLESINMAFPGINLSQDKVLFTYSGFRPLIMKKAASDHPSDASREDYYEVSGSGLITVTGGKLTTARLMAVKTLRLVYHQLKRKASPCTTDRKPIGGDSRGIPETVTRWLIQHPNMKKEIVSMYSDFGPDFSEFFKQYLCDFSGNHCIDPEIIRLRYICRNEMAVKLEDIIERRIGSISWNILMRKNYARRYRTLLQEELGLSSEEFENQFEEYMAYLRIYHSPGEDAEALFSATHQYQQICHHNSIRSQVEGETA
jgi:glycerol-3-phosphate dehydrogenase